MSRTEADREDLLAEAVALVRRVEFHVPGRDEPVVCGFRRDGSLSVYLGQDPVYHFDASQRLRRAYRNDALYRTQGTTLAEMTRDRGEARSTLFRRDLTPTQLAEFLNEMQTALRQVRDALCEGSAAVSRPVPEDDAELLHDVAATLDSIVQHGPQLAPAIAGKV